MLHRYFAVFVLALVGLLATAAESRADQALDAAMEPIWLRYWMAISAEKQSNEVTFTQQQYDIMTHIINQRVQNAISAGRRGSLIDEADNRIYNIVFKYGCNSEEVGPYLRLFFAELAPALGYHPSSLTLPGLRLGPSFPVQSAEEGSSASARGTPSPGL